MPRKEAGTPKGEGKDPIQEIPMHPLEFQTLLVLLDGNLHGYGIAKKIEAREGGVTKILPTNLYRRLRDLAKKGLISESQDEAGGPRKLFRITPYGREVARAEARRLEALVRLARGRDLLPSNPGER
jgi:DNA-binding PadR family transcriptional regulator